jgi:hypothetical protein
VAQAGYDLVTGLWPVLGVAVIGSPLASAGLRRRVTQDIAGLAVGSCAALAMIDVVYVARGRISRLYLLDGLVNMILIGGWVMAWRQGTLPGQLRWT